jgi:Undecaprenyl-phosphate glucose phosphotransferase
MLRISHPIRSKLFYFADTSVIVVSLLISWWYKKTVDSHFVTFLQDYLIVLIGIIPIYMWLYFAFDLYSSKRGQSFADEFVKLVEANIVGCILLFCLFFAFKLTYVSRQVIIQFAIINTVLSILERYSSRFILKYLWAKGFNLRYMLIIGAGDLGTRFLKKIERHREFGYCVMGFLDDDVNKHGTKIGKTNVIAKIAALEDYLNKSHIDEVVVALPLAAYEKLGFIIGVCEKYGIKVSIIPDYCRYIPAKPKVTEIDEMPLIYIRDIPLDATINRLIKRSFDIIISFVLIILFSPLMVLIAIGVKLSSPGPVFFQQKRVGLNRKPFDMYKFRSMRVSSDEVAATTWTTVNDRRRTAIGEFIRKTSLDELPQFFNVLKGDMSIIGPRPERPHFVNQFKEVIPNYMVKHQVKPGITGWAQVNGWRGDTSIEERIKCDLYYIENWSLMLDIKILFMTAFKGLIHKNAY